MSTAKADPPPFTVFTRLRALLEREVEVRFEGPHLRVNFDDRELLYRDDVGSESELIVALGHALRAVDQARSPMPSCWIETRAKTSEPEG